MPLYEYECVDCEDRIELLQSSRQMEEVRDQLRCAKCEGKMQWQFPIPRLATDTTFAANWGDGFGDRESMQRNQAKRVAAAAGVSTAGRTYCPSLCARGKPKDPAAWVPQHDAKSYIKKRCADLNLNCEEFGVTSREPERDPLEGPYRVADDIVEREVDQLVDRDHGGTVPARKRADMAEAVTERLAGNMNE